MKFVWFVASLALGAATASAQWSPAPVTITYLEGSVSVDGQSVPPLEAALNVKKNSVVQSGKGRAEIHFGRGDTLFLGENSSIRVYPDPNTRSGGLEILTGSAVVITGDVGPAEICQDTVHLSDAGVFRFDVHKVLGDDFCRLKVYGSAAGAQMPSFVWVLTPGKTIDLNRTCGDTPRETFHTADVDDFDRWSRQRVTARPSGERF